MTLLCSLGSAARLSQRAELALREKVRFDALSVQAPVSLLAAGMAGSVDLTQDELVVLGDSIKFSGCLAPALLLRTVIARNFDLPFEGVMRMALTGPRWREVRAAGVTFHSLLSSGVERAQVVGPRKQGVAPRGATPSSFKIES
jgi:hypothetical protein